jgi:class 3 adenylate cyclase
MSVELQERIEILSKVSIFEQTSREVLAEVANAMTEVTLNPEEQIFKKGEKGQEMYVIVEGAVRIHDGSYVFAVLRQGQVFGEYTLLEPDSGARSASATSIVKTSLLALGQEKFYKLMSDKIDVMKGILAVLIKRARRQNYFEEKMNEQAKELERQRDLITQEKEKSEKLLLNILPADVAEELKMYGRAEVRSYDLVSVLFTDVKGFTSSAENLTPQEVVQNLEAFFTAFDEIVNKHHLEKIKTIGDAYMCAGGIPNPNKTNPIEMVLAALEMQRYTIQLREEAIINNLPPWELRIGINSGPIIAGVIGKNKFAYDIWGDTVNLASRMESSGEINHVNISGATYELIKDFFDCEYRGKVNAKGKGEVDMYFVIGIKPDLSENGEGMEPNYDFKDKLRRLSKA